MDMARRIICQEQRAAEDRLKQDREARQHSLDELKSGPAALHRRGRIIENVPFRSKSSEDVIRQVIRDEEEHSIVRTRRRGILSRTWSRVCKWWHKYPESHTHRIVRNVELKKYENMPRTIDDLYEVDDKGKKIEDPPFEKVIVEAGTTGKLCKTLFAGVLIIELADSYIVAGWEHVQTL